MSGDVKFGRKSPGSCSHFLTTSFDGKKAKSTSKILESSAVRTEDTERRRQQTRQTTAHKKLRLK